MTKAELDEYCSELEGVIEDAYTALLNDDAEKAEAVLKEYAEEPEEEE